MGPFVIPRDGLWPSFHFWRHHFWPKSVGTIFIQLMHKEKIFPMMPRSEWSAEWSLRYAQKCPKSWAKNTTQSKVSSHYTWLLYVKNCPSRWRFLRSFLTASKPSRRSITAAKKKGKGEKGKAKKKFQKSKSLKVSKFCFLRMPDSKCTKTRCWLQERQAVVLQTHFRPD